MGSLDQTTPHPYVGDTIGSETGSIVEHTEPIEGPDVERARLRSYTVLTAKLLGIDLTADEIEPVVEQVARVAGLVDQLDRIDDDAITSAPRFRPGDRPIDR